VLLARVRRDARPDPGRCARLPRRARRDPRPPGRVRDMTSPGLRSDLAR